MPLFIGRVWSDGDPFPLLDAADAPAWSRSFDEHVTLVDELMSGMTELAVGDGRALVLQPESGEGALEVPAARYAVREGRLDEERFGIDIWRIAR